jgi:hypothetical protein
MDNLGISPGHDEDGFTCAVNKTEVFREFFKIPLAFMT